MEVTGEEGLRFPAAISVCPQVWRCGTPTAINVRDVSGWFWLLLVRFVGGRLDLNGGKKLIYFQMS